MPAVSLTDIQQQIAQREQELQALREQLQVRQNLFNKLARRKQQLQRQLHKVEKDIAALATTATTPTEPATTTAATVPPGVPSGSQPRLGELIVTLLREGKKPMTARQLSDEAQRGGYRLSSRDPVKAMEKRLQDLKHQGIVRRAPGNNGFVLASSANGGKKQKRKTNRSIHATTQKRSAKPTKSEPAATKGGRNGSTSVESAKTSKPGRRGRQPPLRQVLTDVLRGSRQPLSGSELAERALAAGYQTESTKFVDSVWARLGQMDNVEHLPQKGYRLKKT
jgi:hypothetical protein